MDIKNTDPVTVLSLERTVTIPQIASVSAELCPLIEEEAARHGLAVVGPWIFVSHGLPQDGRTAFRAAFCLPVSAESAYEGACLLRPLEPIRCASRHFTGPLGALFSEGYGPLMRAAQAAGHVFTGESREVYHRWNGPDATDNVIEIQFGLR